MNSFSKESLPRRPRLLSLSLQTLGLNLDISLHQCSFPAILMQLVRHEAFATHIISTNRTFSIRRFRSSSIAPVSWMRRRRKWCVECVKCQRLWLEDCLPAFPKIPSSPDSSKFGSPVSPGGPGAMPALFPRAGRRIGLPRW